jgi:hypothetical protein
MASSSMNAPMIRYATMISIMTEVADRPEATSTFWTH